MSNENSIRALPALQTSMVPTVRERIAAMPPSYFEPPEAEEGSVPLSHSLWILKRRFWRILAFVVASVVATIVISSRLTPIYESTATLDIDRQMPAAVIGEESSARAGRASLTDSEQFLSTQVALLQSDSVLRPVVHQMRIPQSDIGNRPEGLPTARAEDAPITLRRLKVSRQPNTYLLLINYRSPDPQFAADVANKISQSYIEHTYNIRFRAAAGLSAFMERQMEELRAKTERSSAALMQFERELNVINPEEKTSILSARILQLNAEFTTAQGDRVRKEAAFSSVKDGSLQAAQASTQGEQLRKLADRVEESKERFATIKVQYGSNHPEFKKALSQLTELERQLKELNIGIGQRVGVEYQQALARELMLKKAVAETKLEFDRLNARSYEYKSLKQSAEADKKLYEELVRKIKEAGINSSFQNSSIRLADLARPPLRPVFPNISLNVLLAILFSTLLGVGAAVVFDAMDTTVRDPDQVQRGLKTDVIGSLPVVKAWRGYLLPAATNKEVARHKSSARRNQAEAFEEAVRSLRNSILLSDALSRPRTLLVTSAAPREGKSTTAVFLAMAHSQQKHKTLLIDADLRRPSLQDRFGIPNERGLTGVVDGQLEWRDVRQTPEAFPDLDIVPAGPASRRAADRVGPVLEMILAEALDIYDLIIVDAPPLLGFAEPLQIATMVDGVVVIALAGKTNRKAVASVLSSLKRVRANIVGVVLNEVHEDMSDRYYYSGYSGKYYSKYYK